MSNWELIAKKCEADYGVQVDWGEEFFVCPECGDPIYSSDYKDEDFIKNDYYICPICELPLFFEILFKNRKES